MRAKVRVSDGSSPGGSWYWSNGTPRGIPSSPPLEPAALLLPFDGCGRLGGQVEDDAVDLGDLVDDPARDRLEQVVREARPVGGHRVVGGDGADDDRIAVRALVALDANRADRGQHGEALPQLAVEAGAADLVEQDRVRLAQDVEPLAGHLADDPDREAGAGEGVTPDELLGQPELLPNPAHLVLE